jgi:hypothetical protein
MGIARSKPSGAHFRLGSCLFNRGLGSNAERKPGGERAYSSFGIGVDRKHALKWLFHQEKATLHYTQKVFVYSETALEILF